MLVPPDPANNWPTSGVQLKPGRLPHSSFIMLLGPLLRFWCCCYFCRERLLPAAVSWIFC